MDRLRNEHPARCSERFETGRDVDAVTVYPRLIVDDVPEVDANAKQHPAIFGRILVACRHDGLDLDRALDRADHAAEHGENTIAGRVHDAAAVAGHQRQDHGLVALEVADRGGFVLAHKPAVAGDVGGKNGSEPALDRGFFVHHVISLVIGGATPMPAVFSRQPLVFTYQKDRAQKKGIVICYWLFVSEVQ